MPGMEHKETPANVETLVSIHLCVRRKFFVCFVFPACCFISSFSYLPQNFFMDTNELQDSIFAGMPAKPPGVFGTRIPSSVTFAAAVLLFFLPFAEIKCNSTSLAHNSGLGIAIGKEWKVSENAFGGLERDERSSSYANTKNNPNAYALVALILGMAAVILSILNARTAWGIAMISGVLAAISLIGLWIDLKRDKRWSLNESEKAISGNNYFGKMEVSLQMTPWFYVSVIAFLVAAFFCYKRTQLAKQ